jgi:hypothetical protein
MMKNNVKSLNNESNIFLNVISWFFGIAFLAIGIINMIWGNDFFFGLFLAALTFVFFPPITTYLKIWLNIKLPWYIKVALAVFIIFAALGVGELPEKIDMMLGK